MPSSAASVSSPGRSGPSPTRTSTASARRRCAKARSQVVHALDLGHPAEPADEDRVVGHAELGAHPLARAFRRRARGARGRARAGRRPPSPGGARCSRRRSSRTSGDDGDEASLTRARTRSTRRKTTVLSGEKYPRRTWPWKVCTTTFGRADPASSAAMRPIVPAFAVCVWRMCGRSRRISRTSSSTAATSSQGRDLPLERADVDRAGRRAASASTPSSPRPRRRVRRRASSRIRGGRARGSDTRTCWAGPPTLSRAMTRRMRIGSDTPLTVAEAPD